MENNPNPSVEPNKPDQGQSAQPNKPDTEINPGGPATNTEVDLDRDKTRTYPNQNPPERQ